MFITLVIVVILY